MDETVVQGSEISPISIETGETKQFVSFPVDSIVTLGVQSSDGNEMMMEISGYGLNVSFNMRLINSLADAEIVAHGIADVFYQELMRQLLDGSKNINKTP